MNYLPLLIILFSCGEQNRTTDSIISHIPAINQQAQNNSRTSICINGFNKYSDLKVNEVDINNIDFIFFLLQYPKYDSIQNQIIYYGKSSIMIDTATKSVLEIQIRDENLRLNNSINISHKTNDLKKIFPCSFKNLEIVDDASNTKFLTLYDDSFNKIYITFKQNEIISIVYIVDESDFDLQD